MTPASATLCIRRVRTSTSAMRPSESATAVCSDWYRLNLGAAMKSLNSAITGTKQVCSSPSTA